ncbi:MAG TPA: DUF2158 domain-containing protein [Acidobacteriaceae bacterium]|jgi:uncharacterized protein YodC (DUF2158 family)|nr:DUF2158 domain-containing protein [Acidobacteriaceae bacterium]
MSNWKIGDTVKLKSGSPLMTIAETGLPGNMVVCLWFNLTERKEGTFPPETLEAAAKAADRFKNR